jgi:hypothetical protein
VVLSYNFDRRRQVEKLLAKRQNLSAIASDFSVREKGVYAMRDFFVWQFLAAFPPFIAGFSDVTPDKDIEQVTVKKTVLFHQGKLFYPSMANSTRSYVPISPTSASTSPSASSTNCGQSTTA